MHPVAAFRPLVVAVMLLAACSAKSSSPDTATPAPPPIEETSEVASEMASEVTSQATKEPVFDPVVLAQVEFGCSGQSAPSWCVRLERVERSLAGNGLPLLSAYTDLPFDPLSVDAASEICTALASNPPIALVGTSARFSVLAEGSLFVHDGSDGCVPVEEISPVVSPRRWTYRSATGTSFEVVESRYVPFSGDLPDRIAAIDALAKSRSCTGLRAEVAEGSDIAGDELFSPMVRRAWAAFGGYASDLAADLGCR